MEKAREDKSPPSVSCLNSARLPVRRYRWTMATIQDSKVPESPGTSAPHVATALSYQAAGQAGRVPGDLITQDSFKERGHTPGPGPDRSRRPTFWGSTSGSCPARL